MKTRTLTITLTILAVLAGIAAVNFAGQQQKGPQPAIPSTQLTAAEQGWILQMYEEEKLARDVYLSMDELWDAQIFANISESEQRHMDAVYQLITRYGLTVPVTDDIGAFTNVAIAALYTQYMTQGSQSLEEALNVGFAIETLDIADLEKALTEVSMRAVQRVFNNLLEGSYNHLSAFTNAMETGIADCPAGTCQLNCVGCTARQGGPGYGKSGNGDGICPR